MAPTKAETELDLTEELFQFLMGSIPEGYKIQDEHIPRLTADQAWTVVWYLGNLYRQIPDTVSRCDVCGDLYHDSIGGECLDFGEAPYHFCDTCCNGEAAAEKRAKHPDEIQSA